MPDPTSIVLAAATVIAVFITRGRERRDEMAHSNSNLAVLVRHALLGFTDIDDILDLQRPTPVRPPWSPSLEVLARVVGLRMYTARLVLYEPNDPDTPRVIQTSGAASSAAAFFNAMARKFGSINACVLPAGTNAQSLGWHDPEGGCIVWVEQIYTQCDWMPRRKPDAARPPAEEPSARRSRWALVAVVATAAVGFGLNQVGGWVGLAGAAVMLLATAGALVIRRAKPTCPHGPETRGGRRLCRSPGETQQPSAEVPSTNGQAATRDGARCAGKNPKRCDVRRTD